MYRKIMVPVDLAHIDDLEKAVATAADLAKHYQAPLVLLGVTASGPTHVAGTPQQYEQLLERYALAQGKKHSMLMEPKAVVDPDPMADLQSVLRDQIDALGVDLVIMASHVPSLRDYLFNANAIQLASHANVSVFIVR